MVDYQYEEGLQLVHRVWVAKYDQETDITILADRLLQFSFKLISHIVINYMVLSICIYMLIISIPFA